jgi:hypothetical protein
MLFSFRRLMSYLFLGALSDERSGLSFVNLSLESFVKVKYIFTFFYVIHISNMYIQYIQGLLHSRLGTTDYALLFTSSSCYNGSSDT